MLPGSCSRPWKTPRLRRALGRLREALFCAVVRPREDKRFLVVSAERNAGEAAVRCLASVFAQKYDRRLVRHVFIDDASTDDTAVLIEKWLARHPDHNVEFIRNPERMGLCANNVRGFGMAEPGWIVLEVNGDDWLPDGGVLRFLNKVYADHDLWMTHNTYRHFSRGRVGRISTMLPASERRGEQKSVREAPWNTSHLHSFRAELFFHLNEGSLVDPESGEYWESAVDKAFYLPMLELAGRHARNIFRVTYVYNLRESSQAPDYIAAQKERKQRVIRLPAYQPLDELSMPHTGAGCTRRMPAARSAG
jgi:glycosyltransferase involved in cell wall biosynthesis